MKRKLNYTAALATTAAVALLAGAAHAQMGGSPQVCTTTQNSPAHNNCVMPTAAAPGGGSFPGSFLVPGTNTSLAIHGFIQFDIQHQLGPHFGDTTWGANATPLEGTGITAAGEQAHALNGGTTMSVKPTRPNIETRTPTAYGELKTYIEFDFNQTSGTQLAGNNNLIRLRHAYGTLGPWLVGQTFSEYTDPQAYADTATGAQDVGMLNTFNVRRPQIRYTWLAGNGLSIAGSVEEPSYPGNVVATLGSATAAAASTVALNGTTIYYNIPKFVGAGEWDQPWGHLKLALAGGVAQARQANVLVAGGTTTTPNLNYGEWAVHLSGHVNTWGKDALRGGIWYNHGAADFDSWISQGGLAMTIGGGGGTKIQHAWAGYASYEHFFNGQWRANEAFGYERISGIPVDWSAASLTGLQKVEFSNEVNVIYSPVPQTDFFLEWQHINRIVMSGAHGTDDNIDLQAKFYF